MAQLVGLTSNWNSANKDIFYGKAADLAGGGREHVEVSALALHLVQAAIVGGSTGDLAYSTVAYCC